MGSGPKLRSWPKPGPDQFPFRARGMHHLKKGYFYRCPYLTVSEKRILLSNVPFLNKGGEIYLKIG